MAEVVWETLAQEDLFTSSLPGFSGDVWVFAPAIAASHLYLFPNYLLDVV